MSILTLEQISYTYEGTKKPVLSNLSYSFDAGRIYAVVGRSGAGKTTLLSLLSGLARPTGGRILFKGDDVAKINPYTYRSRQVGVVFQSFNLLPKLTAVENVVLSMDVAGIHDKAKNAYAMSLLAKVGLEQDEARRRILKLSGGQQQRVAIARAISYAPEVILADEPTGNLDGETQDEIMGIFRHLASEEGKSIIIVTHSPQVARQADVVYELKAVRSVPHKAS